MAALDFPASPSTGQTYAGPGGAVWSWDGAKWVNGASAVAFAPINAPIFTGDARAVTPAAGDNDTSIATSAFVQSTVAPAFNGVGRNLLHNPLFNVAQRGAGPWTATGYTADRWVITAVTDTVSVTVTALTDAARTQIGDESAISALQTSFTGTASGATYLEHRIEGVRRLAGKTVVVSFCALSGVAGLKLGSNLVQNFGAGGSPSAQVITLATGNVSTLTTGWTRYSFTASMPSVSGKTIGTNNNDYTVLRIYSSCGAASDANASGNIGMQSGVFALWGVQLEVGSVATPLEKPDPQQDLAKCMRMFRVGTINMRGYNTAGTFIIMTYPFSVQMRAAPTVIPTSTGGSNTTAPSVGTATADMVSIAVGMVATGDGYANSTFTASADL